MGMDLAYVPLHEPTLTPAEILIYVRTQQVHCP